MNRQSSQMGVLHYAVSLERNDLVDLILMRDFDPFVIDLVLMSELADINLMSPNHGTPIHLASKIGNLKIV